MLVSASWAPRNRARLASAGSGRRVPSIRRVASAPVSRQKSSTRALSWSRVGSRSPRRAPTACRASASPALASSADPLDRGGQADADRLSLGQLARALKLDGQSGQRVGEHVVQLAGDAAALGQGGRGRLRVTCVLELGQEYLGAVLALPAAAA